MKVSEIKNKNSHHKWLTDRVTEDTEVYLKSDLRMTFESFQTLIYNEIMYALQRDYSLLCECVNCMSIYLRAVWNFSGPFYLSFDVFFLSVNLLLWQEPWKKGKLVVKKTSAEVFLKKKNLLACMADSKRALCARFHCSDAHLRLPGCAVSPDKTADYKTYSCLFYTCTQGSSFWMLSFMHVAKHASKINLELF